MLSAKSAYKPILIIGDLMLDQYLSGTASRISPEAPVPVVKITKESFVPGGAANVALNIASINHAVTLMGIVGEDLNSQKLEAFLNQKQIKNYLLKTQLPTITKTRVISQHQQMLRIDHEESFFDLDKTYLLNQLDQILSHHSLLILSDYGKGTLSHSQELIKKARNLNIPVLIDPKGADFSKYKNASILTPNFSEFLAVAGPCETEEILFFKAKNLINQLNLEALLITRSADGMSLITKDSEQLISIPTQAQEVFDVTGAGDTVIAIFGLAIAQGHDLISAMTMANAAAGIVVGKLGAACVTPEELSRALHQEISSKPLGILNLDQAKQAIQEAQNLDEKVVFTNGCFDLLHSGHLTYLKEAKALGNRLIIAVNSDQSIQKLKGPTRPIIPLQERMEMLAALSFVDWVISFDEDTPEFLLNQLKPDILVKGGDYKNKNQIIGYQIVEAYGGEVKSLSLKPGFSTSHIIKKIINKNN